MLRFRSVFSRLFVSVFLALIGFAAALFLWIIFVHNDSDILKNRSIASQIVNQIDPFLTKIDDGYQNDNLIQARFALAVIKKSFDIFDENLNAKIGLYNPQGQLILETDHSNLPKTLLIHNNWASALFPTLLGHPAQHTELKTQSGYILWYESRTPPKPRGFLAVNLLTAILLFLFMISLVLWIIAKNLTRRLETMGKQMALFGEGDFNVRITEEGNDEITALAYGFNQSAQKIERLINANNLLLAHASHEFRTPITRIRLQTEMLSMMGDSLTNTQKALLDKRTRAINKDLNGLNDMIESILLVSRLKEGHALEQMQRIDFYELISEECQHFEQASLYGQSVLMEAQPKLLTHLIRNLLNNAMIHGTPPITVYVYGCQTSDETANIPSSLVELINAQNAPTPTKSDAPTSDKKSNFFDLLKKDITIKDIPQKPKKPTHNFAVLSVIDEGSGIPSDKRDDIFSPFVRLKQEKKGSGLGLSLVAQIVEMHNGRIITDTWHGKTRFLVVLPCNPASLSYKPKPSA